MLCYHSHANGSSLCWGHGSLTSAFKEYSGASATSLRFEITGVIVTPQKCIPMLAQPPAFGYVQNESTRVFGLLAKSNRRAWTVDQMHIGGNRFMYGFRFTVYGLDFARSAKPPVKTASSSVPAIPRLPSGVAEPTRAWARASLDQINYIHN